MKELRLRAVVALCAALLPWGARFAGAGAASGESGGPAAELVRQADAAFDTGDFARARALYDQAMRGGSSDAHALGRLALLIGWDGDLDGSIRIYRQALDRFPDHPDLLLGLGQALGLKGRYADADAIYRRMEDRRIEPIRAHLGRAVLLDERGDLDGAGHFYRDVLRADPGNLQARIGMARVAHRQGLDRAAREQANNILLDHPQSREARDLKREIDRGLEPQVDPGGSRTVDSGGNRIDAAILAYSFSAEPQTRIRLSYASYDARSRCKSLPLCDEGSPLPPVDRLVSTRARVLTAGLTSRLIGPLTFHARLGAAREESFDGTTRTVAVGGGFVRWQVGPRLAIIGTGAREPLLDSAPLIDRGIKVDSADIRLSYAFRPSWALVGDAGYGSYSDGNARQTAGVALDWRLPTAHPWIRGSLDARYRAFHDERQNGYFDPERYDAEVVIVEIRDSYRHDRITWRLEGTLGRQSFDAPPATSARPGRDDTVEALHAACGVALGAHVSLEAFYAKSDFALQLVTGFASSRSGLLMTIRL